MKSKYSNYTILFWKSSHEKCSAGIILQKSIKFFGTFYFLFISVSGAYQKSYERTQKQQKEQKEANRIAEEISIATKGNATKEEIYYLKEVDGYVVVYKEDKETIFEVTSIRVESLPEEIKAEVQAQRLLA